MKKNNCFRMTVLSVSLSMMALFLHSAANSQTAGGSVVLCCCNSYVEFMTNTDCGFIEIVNLCKISSNKSRVNVAIDGVVNSKQIDYNSSIKFEVTPKTTTHTVRITNIEKGGDGKLCNGKGPGDGDVRVLIPANVTNIVVRGLPAENKCSVCGVSFLPKVQ